MSAEEPSAEVDIKWEMDDFSLKVTAVLGEASVVVEHAWDAAEETMTLIAALPNILDAVQGAINAQEAEQ